MIEADLLFVDAAATALTAPTKTVNRAEMRTPSSGARLMDITSRAVVPLWLDTKLTLAPR